MSSLPNGKEMNFNWFQNEQIKDYYVQRCLYCTNDKTNKDISTSVSISTDRPNHIQQRQQQKITFLQTFGSQFTTEEAGGQVSKYDNKNIWGWSEATKGNAQITELTNKQ